MDLHERLLDGGHSEIQHEEEEEDTHTTNSKSDNNNANKNNGNNNNDDDNYEEVSEAEAAQLRNEEEARIIKAVNLAVRSAGNLNNLLPSGTFLFFQYVLPIVSDGGKCGEGQRVEVVLTILLIAVCATWCFVLSFTDTAKAPDGHLHHGIATWRGLWIPGQPAPRQSGALFRYRVRPIDFLHALLCVAVFVTAALFTPNASDCLFGKMGSVADSDLWKSLPLLVGFIASFVCIMVPSTRRGFDQPLLERLADHLE